MAKKLTHKEIEELEFVHLERIRYYFLDNIDDIMKDLHSRLKIKDDWYKQFIFGWNYEQRCSDTW